MTIPEMTHPLGSYWRQPRDIRDAPMDEETVLLTPAQYEGLSEYSITNPSGVYPGKCWRAEEYDGHPWRGGKPTGRWFLCWFGEVEGRPDLCSNNSRQIEVVSD